MTLSDTITTLGNNIVSLIGTRANKDLSNLSTIGESKLGGINTELFNNKIDKNDLRVIYPIIKTHLDGTSGYRIWAKDNYGYYCEQWGVSAVSSSNALVSFSKTFNDTNYTIVLADTNPTGTDADGVGYGPMAQQLSTSSMKISQAKESNRSTRWKVSGYLLAGEEN